MQKLLTRSRGNHPAIHWLYVIVAYGVYVLVTFMPASLLAQDATTTHQESQPLKGNLNGTQPDTRPAALTDQRYLELLNEFSELKQRLEKSRTEQKGQTGAHDEILELQVRLARVQSQLEVLDQERRASLEITEFLKNRLQQTEADLQSGGGVTRNQYDKLSKENLALRDDLQRTREQLELVERQRKLSAEKPKILQKQLEETESRIQQTATLPPTERTQVIVRDNEELKQELDALRTKYENEIVALEQEKQASMEVANQLRDRLQDAETRLQKTSPGPESSSLAPVAVERTTEVVADGADAERLNRNNEQMRQDLEQLKSELAAKNAQLEKERQTHENASAFFQDRLKKAEQNLRSAGTSDGGDARYDILVSKNNTLKEELARVHQQFQDQLEVLEREKAVLSDASRSLSERLRKVEEDLRFAQGAATTTTVAAPELSPTPTPTGSEGSTNPPQVVSAPPPVQTYPPRPPQPVKEPADLQPETHAIVTDNKTQVAPETLHPVASGSGTPPPDGSPDRAFDTLPAQPVDASLVSDDAQERTAKPVETKPVETAAVEPAPSANVSAIENRLEQLEEHLREVQAVNQSGTQALQNQNRSMRSDLSTVKKRLSLATADGKPVIMGELPAETLQRIDKMEEEKKLGADAALAMHERLKQVEEQLQEIDKVNTMSATVAGQLHQRLLQAENKISSQRNLDQELEMMGKERQMTAEVTKALHERLKGVESQLQKLNGQMARMDTAEGLKAEAVGALNDRLKRAESDLQKALSNSQSYQDENDSMRDQIARLQERLDTGGVARAPRTESYVARQEPYAAPRTSLPPTGDGQLDGLRQENENLRQQLLGMLSNQARENTPPGAAPAPSAPSPAAPIPSNDAAYAKYQKQLEENIQLKQKLDELLYGQKKLEEGTKVSEDIRDQLTQLRTQFDQNDVERQGMTSVVPPSPVADSRAPLSHDEQIHALIQSNGELIDQIDRANKLRDAADPRRSVADTGDKVVQMLLNQRDELKDRLREAEIRLNKISGITGTINADRELGMEQPPVGRGNEVEPSVPVYNGHVTLLKSKGNFAIIKFPGGKVPPVRTKLDVYRDGILVGNIQITNPIKPPLASADIVSGSLRIGDEVR